MPGPVFSDEDRAKIQALERPALHLVRAIVPGFSRLGGLPLVPHDFEWPAWNQGPLAFLAQLNLAEISYPDIGSMPASGFLYFFYDQFQSAIGADPEDRGGVRVIYQQGATKDFVQAARPTELLDEGLFLEKPVQAIPIWSLPGWESSKIKALGLNEDLWESYYELAASPYGGKPAHQLLGEAPFAEFPESGMESDPNRRLLLQLDSDGETGMMWGDAGVLYYWVERDDLQNRKFGDVSVTEEYS